MASGFGEKRCPLSAIPGIGTGRIRSDAIRAAGTRALRRTVDSESPPATDMPPGTPGRPPRRRTAAGILGDWSGTAGAAQPYTTHRGLLNQADKQEPANWSARAALELGIIRVGPVGGHDTVNAGFCFGSRGFVHDANGQSPSNIHGYTKRSSPGIGRTSRHMGSNQISRWAHVAGRHYFLALDVRLAAGRRQHIRGDAAGRERRVVPG